MSKGSFPTYFNNKNVQIRKGIFMESEFIAQTALDQMVGTDQGQLLKALIPYLPPRCSRPITNNTKSLLSLYSGHKVFSISASSS